MKSVTRDATNKKIILELDDNEWTVVNHLDKVFGPTFFQNHIEEFIRRREVQKEGNRRQKIGQAFKKADANTKKQIIGLLGVDFNDE